MTQRRDFDAEDRVLTLQRLAAQAAHPELGLHHHDGNVEPSVRRLQHPHANAVC